MIEKNSVINDNNNENLDTKEELYNSLYNLFNKENKYHIPNSPLHLIFFLQIFGKQK